MEKIKPGLKRKKRDSSFNLASAQLEALGYAFGDKNWSIYDVDLVLDAFNIAIQGSSFYPGLIKSCISCLDSGINNLVDHDNSERDLSAAQAALDEICQWIKTDTPLGHELRDYISDAT